MTCILGHRSGFPCPICLVPRLEQSNISKVWPRRTVSASKELLSRASLAPSLAKKEDILREQSLRDIQVISALTLTLSCLINLTSQSTFFDIIPSFHSIYNAVVADPLHQIEQGIWGKHLWPWIRDQLSQRQKGVLDER